MRTIEDKFKISIQGAFIAAVGTDGLSIFQRALAKSETASAIAINGTGSALSVAMIGCLPLALHLAFKK